MNLYEPFCPYEGKNNCFSLVYLSSSFSSSKSFKKKNHYLWIKSYLIFIKLNHFRLVSATFWSTLHLHWCSGATKVKYLHTVRSRFLVSFCPNCLVGLQRPRDLLLCKGEYWHHTSQDHHISIRWYYWFEILILHRNIHWIGMGSLCKNITWVMILHMIPT